MAMEAHKGFDELRRTAESSTDGGYCHTDSWYFAA